MKTHRVTRLMPRVATVARAVQNQHGLAEPDVEAVVGEMVLALLEAPEGLSERAGLRRAAWRGLDSLRRERCTRRRTATVPFEEMVELVDSGRCRRVWC